MRFRFFGVVATCFLAAVYAFPIRQSHNSDLALPRVNRDAAACERRDLHPASHKVPVYAWIAPRAGTLISKKARKVRQKARQKASAHQIAAKLPLGKKAKEQLDALGLHGTARKDAIHYHRRVVKAAMKTKGGTSGKIFHIAHEGGSVASEPNHITAQFYDKGKKTIGSKYEAEDGTTKTGDLHHVYTDQHSKVKPPKSFLKAVAKSPKILPTKKPTKKDPALKAAEADKKKEEAKIKKKETYKLKHAEGLKTQAAKKAEKLKL